MSGVSTNFQRVFCFWKNEPERDNYLAFQGEQLKAICICCPSRTQKPDSFVWGFNKVSFEFLMNFSKCLILNRTNLYGVNIFLFKQGEKHNENVIPNFGRHKIGKFFWGFISFNVGGINGFSTSVLFLEERT
jgi:hypothetical protein